MKETIRWFAVGSETQTPHIKNIIEGAKRAKMWSSPSVPGAINPKPTDKEDLLRLRLDIGDEAVDRLLRSLSEGGKILETNIPDGKE